MQRQRFTNLCSVNRLHPTRVLECLVELQLTCCDAKRWRKLAESNTSMEFGCNPAVARAARCPWACPTGFQPNCIEVDFLAAAAEFGVWGCAMTPGHMATRSLERQRAGTVQKSSSRAHPSAAASVGPASMPREEKSPGFSRSGENNRAVMRLGSRREASPDPELAASAIEAQTPCDPSLSNSTVHAA